MGVIHRFTFSRGDGGDTHRTEDEFSRLVNVLSEFKRVLDAEADLRKKKLRSRYASFVLTLMLFETEV
jgi:hypothetical protein